MKIEKDSDGHPRLSDAQFWHYYRRYPYLLAKVALWGVVIGAFYWLTRNVESVLFPILVSLLIAYLLDPAVDRLQKVGDKIDALKRADASRTMAIIVFMLGILGALIGFLFVLYPTLARQVTNLASRAPDLVNVIEDNLLPWLEQTTGYEVPASISDALAQYGGALREQLPAAAKRLSSLTTGVLSQTGAVVASLLNLVMIPVFTFYFLRDFDVMRMRMRDFVPVARRDYYLGRIAMMDEVVGAWFRGQVTVALILALLYSIGLGIVFGVAGIGVGSGIAIGVLSGVLNIIPYFGFLIGFLLSMLLVLLDWGGVGPVVGVCIVFGVVQGLEGWIITPKIVGDKVGLSPVMVIIVLLLGGELFGLIGVLLALPVAGIIRAMMPEIVTYYRSTPFYSGEYTADVAAAEAASRTYAGPGLVEQTDGDLDALEVAEAEVVDPTKLKRPVTAEHASVGERPASAPAPLDAGTDGEADDDEEAEEKPDEQSSAKPSADAQSKADEDRD